MSNKKQRIRNKCISIFVGTTGSTGTRDTKINDVQKTYKIDDWFTANQCKKMRVDIIN